MSELFANMPEEFWWGVMLTASALLLAVQTVAMARRRLARRKRQRRSRRAYRAEERAENLLRKQGFIPLDEQVRQEWTVLVDGQEEVVELIADWIVESEGLRFLVEVKTGEFGPSIRYAATRRQLLEYRCAFDVDGLILLDMNTGQWQLIEFPEVSIERSASSGRQS